jgi:hypothetical protein
LINVSTPDPNAHASGVARVAKRTYLYFVLWKLEQCIAYIIAYTLLLDPESVSECVEVTVWQPWSLHGNCAERAGR